jgi:hypothetical protein
MKKIVAIAFVSSIVFSLVSASVAEAKPWWNSRVNQRQRHQQGRLYNGADSGALTRREYGRLQAREAKLQRQEWRQRRDGGGLTRQEAARLNREQNQLSKSIYNQKHDEQVR